MRRKRRNQSVSFKAKVAVAAARGEKILAELAQQYDVHPNRIQDWRGRLVGNPERLFERGVGRNHDTEHQHKELHASRRSLTGHPCVYYRRNGVLNSADPAGLRHAVGDNISRLTRPGDIPRLLRSAEVTLRVVSTLTVRRSLPVRSVRFSQSLGQQHVAHRHQRTPSTSSTRLRRLSREKLLPRGTKQV